MIKNHPHPDKWIWSDSLDLWDSKSAECAWEVVLGLLSPVPRSHSTGGSHERQCRKPEKPSEARTRKAKSQSLVWRTLCSAKSIILRLKFPLLNPEVQGRKGPFAHKKQREIRCYKEHGSTYLSWSQPNSENRADLVCLSSAFKITHRSPLSL